MRIGVQTFVMAAAMLLTATAQAVDVPIDRGAYTLKAQQDGQGELAVVFEAGFGQGSSVWREVIAGLGEECSCVSYSRAGLGDSGTDSAPKTIEAHLTDLAAVIDTLAPGQEVVLVGHSYGGLLATEFARRHPSRVRGLVLVDPATLGQRRDFLQADRARVLEDDAALLKMLPPTMAADYQLLVDQLDRLGATGPVAMPDVSVALLTATRVADEPFVFEETAQGKALWKTQHAALFAQFNQGSHIYFATGHNIHREDPKAVVNAIRLVSKLD
ncbi:alpha/beta hydrolase [Luteimonas sp. MJ174]|uniref:alpha/beta fold hydrolase n=1 Tax=Luteimonas sp. MJ174 TaxID=3129237 RepID=UPI0031BBAE61